MGRLGARRGETVETRQEDASGMLNYLLLLIPPLCTCVQNVMQKRYNAKPGEPNVLLFSAITTFFALLFFIGSSGLRLEFSTRIIPYSLSFGVAYACAWVGNVLAVRYGSLALTTLIVSFTQAAPVIYGIVIGEKLTVLRAVGLAALAVAMFLVNRKSAEDPKPFSAKWLVSLAVTFCGNVVCTLTSVIQKSVLGPEMTHEYMILALVTAFVLLITAAVIRRRDFGAELRCALPFASVNGLVNGSANMTMLYLIGRIPTSVLYPTSTALSMVSTFALAFWIYRERFSKAQYLGYLFGAVSVVLLNS